MIKKFLSKNKKLILTISVLLGIIGIIVGIMNWTGLNTLEKIQSAVQVGGIFSYLIYFALTFIFMIGQFLPTAIIVVAGVYVFGLWQGIVLGVMAVLIGSICLFFIGKYFGTKVVKWISGNEDISKWQNRVTQSKYTLFLLLIFPASPDSLLYVLMGTSKIKFSTFLIMILFSKSIGVITTALLGGGAIIPINLQWAWLWAILGIIMCIVIYLSFKYQTQIDNFFNKFHKK